MLDVLAVLSFQAASLCTLKSWPACSFPRTGKIVDGQRPDEGEELSHLLQLHESKLREKLWGRVLIGFWRAHLLLAVEDLGMAG